MLLLFKRQLPDWKAPWTNKFQNHAKKLPNVSSEILEKLLLPAADKSQMSYSLARSPLRLPGSADISLLYRYLPHTWRDFARLLPGLSGRQVATGSGELPPGGGGVGAWRPDSRDLSAEITRKNVFFFFSLIKMGMWPTRSAWFHWAKWNFYQQRAWLNWETAFHLAKWGLNLQTWWFNHGRTGI